MQIWKILEDAKRASGDAIAAIDERGQYDWRALHGSCVRLAAALERAGVGAHDVVAILADNHLTYLCSYFASAGIDATLAPLNTRWTSREIARVLEDCGCRVVLADRALRARLEQDACAELDLRVLEIEELDVLGPDGEARELGARDPAPAQIYYTSGSTGAPKGVVLSHGNICAHARAAVRELELRARDRWAHIAPLFHLADAWACFAITAVGGSHVFLRRFSAEAALACFREREVTICNLVPTMLGSMLAHEDARRFAYPSLRALLSGGAPIAKELVRAICETFACEYVQTYGMTETSPFLTMSLLSDADRELDAEAQLAIRARTGRPFGETELRVVDASGAEVPRDDASVGEIQVRGPHVTEGYWKAPERTAEAFTRDGFLRTGDLATIDASGSVEIVDRAKDVILSGGETVYSIEVEQRLYAHPSVLEAAVYGVPDETWGERVCATVALDPAGARVSEDELIAFCREALASFKAPKQIAIVPSLPRTGSGKLDKRALRDGARDDARNDSP